MQQFFNTAISTMAVACLALFSLPASNPEPAKNPPAQSQSSISNSLDMTAMQRALESINQKLDRQLFANSDKFDSGGSDGITDSPTWPTPSPNQPRQPVSPDVLGSGSTGSGPAGYSQQFVRSTSFANYRDSYGSNGGYSATQSRSVQASGLLGRVRARSGLSGVPVSRRSVGTGMTCVDGVCYPN